MKKVDKGSIPMKWRMKLTVLLGVVLLSFQTGMAQEDCTGGVCADAIAAVEGVNHTPIMNCGNGATTFGSHSRWFVWTAPADGVVDISSCGAVNTTNSDTQLHLFKGVCHSESFEVVNSSDDECLSANGSYAWAARLQDEPVDSGVTYFIEWNDRYNEAAFDWTLTFVPDPDCDVPTAVAYTSNNCTDGTFHLLLDIADDGDAETYSVSYTTDGGYSFVAVGDFSSGTTAAEVGTFNFGVEVAVAIAHGTDAACDQILDAITSTDELCPTVDCGPTTYQYCYTNNDQSVFVYQAESGADLYLKFIAGLMETGYDYISIYDGHNESDNVLFEGSGLLPAETVLHSETGIIVVRFDADSYNSCQSPNSWGSEVPQTVEYIISCNPFPGCTDPAAINFDPLAGEDDGSCVVPTCTEAPVSDTYCYGNYDATSFLYSGQEGDMPIIQIHSGFTENNYDFITIYDGVNTDAPILYDASGDHSGVIAVSTSGSLLLVFDGDVSVSCTSSGYDPLVWDVYCGAEVVPGCTDPNAVNFNPNATINDDSCEYPIVSCGPDNYTFCYGNSADDRFYYQAESGTNLFLMINAGQMETCCDYLQIYDGFSTDDNLLFSGNGQLPVNELIHSETGKFMVRFTSDSGLSCSSSGYTPFDYTISCENPGVEGCTDPAALNFNPIATDDDGSCIIPACDDDPVNEVYCYNNNDELEFIYAGINEGDLPMLRINSGFTENNWDYITIFDGPNMDAPVLYEGSGDHSDVLVVSTSGYLLLFIDGDALNSCASAGYDPMDWDVYCGVQIIMGCTDPEATNYNPSATDDDGSCIYPPVNDDCVNAIELTVNADLECEVVTSGTVAGATPSEQENPCGGTANDDVWYTFVATATSHTIDLLNRSGSTTDLYHAVYSGSCGEMENLLCSDPESSIVPGLTVGETYLLRIYTYTSNIGQNTTFDVCIGTPPAPPANDNCQGAFEVAVNEDLNCGNVTSGTLAWATSSGVQNCSGTASNDVWFSFTATNETHYIDLLNVSPYTDMYHVVYAQDCDSLVSLVCSDPNNSVATGLTPGEFYLIQVYSYSSTMVSTTFNVCVGTPPPPPANDHCDGAIELSVNESMICSEVTSGTLAFATGSGVDHCFGTANNDVWFSFTATAESHIINLTNVSPYTDMYHAVFAADCGNLVNLSCSDPDMSTVNGLTPGETYLIQVYSYYSSEVSTTFDICVSTLITPENDECHGAIEVLVNDDLECGNVTTGTLAAATESGVNNCSGTPNNDVWFSFTATAESHQIELLNVTPYTDMYHAVYAQECDSLVNLVCSDPNSSVASGLTPGETYLIQVYSYYSSEVMTLFDVCVGTVPAVPDNDLCENAIPIACGETFIGNTFSASNTDAPGTCSTTLNTGPGVWHIVEGFNGVMEASLCNSLFDTKIGIFTGSCGELECLIGNDDDTGTNGAGICGGGTVSSVSWIGVEGETYYIYVTGYLSNAGAYELTVDCTPVTSVDDLDGTNASALVYPNPNAGNGVRVQLDGLTVSHQDVNVVVYDLYGKQIENRTFAHNGSHFNQEIRFNNQLATGMYLVQIIVDGAPFATERLVVN